MILMQCIVAHLREHKIQRDFQRNAEYGAFMPDGGAVRKILRLECLPHRHTAFHHPLGHLADISHILLGEIAHCFDLLDGESDAVMQH